METRKNVILALAIATVFLIAMVGSASALDPCPAPGNTAISSSCELTQNYTVPAGQYGYRITADDVVIDGKSYTITGTVSGDTCLLDINGDDADESHPVNHSGIHIISRTNVTVKNLKVTKFCTGIVLKRGVDCTITSCLIDDNGRADGGPTHGIHVVGSDHCDITKNEICNQKGVADMGDCGCGGNGISFFGGGSPPIRGDYLNVTCNYIHDIAKCGLHSKKKCEYSIIEYNRVENCKAGIMPECKQSNYATIRYNNISNMSAYGFYIRGKGNTIQYNTITGTTQYYGIRIVTDPVEEYGFDNVISNNSVCGSTVTDILVAGGLAATNDVNDNTCGSSDGGTGNHCPWNCDDPVSVYYDYDGDGDCSKRAADCSCNNTLDVGSCCNPGLFNGSDDAKTSYEASCDCQWTVGDDPNDCNASVTPTLTYTVSGYTNPAADMVNITNTNNSKKWAADYIGPDGFYNLTLIPEEDVNATEILQIVACEELLNYESNCNATTHVPENIPGEDTNVNLTLDHYCLNWMTYPYKTWEQSNWSGPAVMQMMIDHYRPEEPAQSDLNATGIAHNQGCNADLQYVDPQGMRWTLNNILHNTASYGGGEYANYGIGNYDTVERALWYICYWQYLGPGAAPTYGDYTNWMAIRGIHTSENPKWKSQGSYDIYGFWINDPKDPGGIGENTYKSVDQWTSTYHKNLTGVRDGDSYKNRYVAVCEPPEQEPGEVRLVHSKARFSGTITAEATDEELTVDVGGVPLNQMVCNRKLAREKENKVVQAAIDGVNEQLAPYDHNFKKTFAGTVAGKPMPVNSDAGDYYLVPFGIESGSESDSKSVLAVVIVDSDGGKFKEASWVNEPVKYLPVTAQEALKTVYKEMKGKSTIKVVKKDKVTGKLKKADVVNENVDTLGDITLDETEKQRRKAYLELVYKGESPYYPVWKITIGDSVFFVDQSGTLTYNEPVSTAAPTPTPTAKPTTPPVPTPEPTATPTPTPTHIPKSIEPVLQIVE